MKNRVIWRISMLGVLGLALSLPVWAADTYEGTVVEVGPSMLTMVDTAGQNQQTHEVPADAAISRAGKMCRLTEVKAGDLVTVVTDQRWDKVIVTKVQANKLAVHPSGCGAQRR